MARNYNPYATYSGYRSRRYQAQGAEFSDRLVRWGRCWGRWLTFIFLVFEVPKWTANRYTCNDPTGYGSERMLPCTVVPDDYMGQLVLIIVFAMIVNTLRYRYDRDKVDRKSDPVSRKVRAVLAAYLSVLVVVQTVRYLEGFTPEAAILATFLAWDYLVINWTRRTQSDMQRARRAVWDYNYVPHAERRTS